MGKNGKTYSKLSKLFWGKGKTFYIVPFIL
jgi:hypothetical protein